ncbi:CubicO group peptidase (beta-lactamase class C family) [Flavobacterium sp. 270]|uniref:serine hydrolase domain-containing protein n=1 Tax=Flavobacterium sp. 270 TaxID=2512114 RepID=UPI001064B05E|nr:serine hydrolase domain-containing protein [Flavobacterium sp. 270]TDW48915.1 CubicO group peptidase (beta-lactamase class C family) [Flavobacterium sp. 270]
MNSIFKISSLAAVLFLCSISYSYSQNVNSLAAQIDSLLAVSSPKFNGTILISQKGKTIYSKAYGFADLEKKTPLEIDNAFEIMSNSKQICAVLVLKEVEKGTIKLNDPIKKYMPELKQSWAHSVTVSQLLNHTHGIEALDKPLLFKPGSDFKYNGWGLGLAGQILEKVTKKSYPALSYALFQKLKMTRTMCYAKIIPPYLVSGYDNKNNVFTKVTSSQINPGSYGSDGIISTVHDLAIWNNNLHKGKILKPETYKLMLQYKILAQHMAFEKEKVGYGYGIRVVDKETPKYIGHTGLGDGFSSINLYYPESDTSLIILENQMNEDSNLFYANEIKIKKLLLKSGLLNQK